MKERLLQVSSTVKQILTKRSVVVDVVLLSAISLVSISWFRGNFLIWSKGFLWPGNWQSAVYAWHDKFSMGLANTREAAMLPYCFFQYITDTLGFTPVASEKLFFFLIFLSAGLSMYYLTWVLQLPRLARLAAALFYMMNPINLNFIQFSAYSLTPFILGAFIWGLREKRGLGFIIAFVSIWTLTTSYAYNHPSALLIHWGILMAYLVYYCGVVARNRPQILSALRFTGLLIVIFVFLNMFWIILMVSTVPTSVEQTQLGTTSNLDLFRGLSAEPLDAVRLLGYGQGLLSTFGGDPIFPWAFRYLKSPPLIIMEILIPIIACLFVFSGDRRRKVGLFFFLALFLMAIFLQKGAKGPLGNFNLWTFERIPYLIDIFRNPQRFGSIVAFSYAPLLGIGVYLIYDFVVKRFRRVWLSVCLLLIFSSTFVFYSLPFWTGELFHPGGQVIPSERIQIPDYYALAREWLHREGEEMARIYPLPFPERYHMAFKWKHGYAEMNPVAYLLDTSVIAYNDNSPGYKVPLLIGQKIEEGYNGDLARLLSLLQVKYLLLHRDAYWEYLKMQPNSFFGESEERIESFLDGQENIHFQRSFGLLDFYKIPDQYFLPRIYPAAKPILVNGSIDEMFEAVTSDNFTIGNNALFLSNQTSKSQREFLEKYMRVGTNYSPTITFQKINPTRYVVRVDNATSPFFLVFSESYHRQWKAYLESKPLEFNEIIAEYSNTGVREARHEMRFTPGDISYLFKKPISEDRHFLVNGYANAWYIDPKEIGKENFTVTLYFRPQSYFYMGLIISGLTFLGCAGYLVYGWRKRRCRTREPNSLTGS